MPCCRKPRTTNTGTWANGMRARTPKIKNGTMTTTAIPKRRKARRPGAMSATIIRVATNDDPRKIIDRVTAAGARKGRKSIIGRNSVLPRDAF